MGSVIGNRVDIRKNEPRVYYWLLKNNRDLLNKIFPSNILNTTSDYFTEKNILKCMLQCKSSGDFYNRFNKLWTYLRRNKTIRNKMYKKAGWKIIEQQTFDLELAISIANKYNTLKTFRVNEPNIYNNLCKRKLIDSVCSHMERHQQPNGYWSKERIIESSKKYKTIKEFRAKEPGAYNKAIKLRILSDLNLINDNENNKPSNYWTYEKCKKIASSGLTNKEIVQKYGRSVLHPIGKFKLNHLIPLEKPKVINLTNGGLFKNCFAASKYYKLSCSAVYLAIKNNSTSRAGHRFVYYDETKHKHLVTKIITDKYIRARSEK